MSNDAEVLLVRDEHGERCVVRRADDVIWLADELMDQARDPNRQRISGDLEVNGDVLTFGTAGEGLGRLTYRLVGRHEAIGYYIAKREQPDLHQETMQT